MISLLVTILLLWLVARYVPHGDKIVAVLVAVILLRWLGLLPVVISI